MAQIQVPININNNKIIEAAGTNARVLVGSTVNLATLLCLEVVRIMKYELNRTILSLMVFKQPINQ